MKRRCTIEVASNPVYRFITTINSYSYARARDEAIKMAKGAGYTVTNKTDVLVRL